MNALILVVALFCTFETQAQWSKKSRYKNFNRSFGASSFYAGFEGSIGTRSYTLTSDIQEFNGLNVIEEGKGAGFVIGGSALLFKLRHGIYNASSTMVNKVDLKETSIAANVMPMQYMANQPKYFEPYVILSFDINTISLHGKALPELKPQPKEKKPCPCECAGSGLPTDPDGQNSNQASSPGTSGPPGDPGNGADPDAPTAATDENPNTDEINVYLGKLNVIRGTVGAGLLCNISGRRTFAKLFAEAKYGTTLGHNSSYLHLQNTSAKGQFALSFGIMMGLKY